jgi:16S rRNA (cytosine1402-N4)-methyltransferase
MQYHTPVLLHDCIEGLNIIPGGIYVDVTYGGGGHSKEILKSLGEGKLFAFDQDQDAAVNATGDKRLVFIPGNFSHLKDCLEEQGVKEVDGILADLGVSSHQFDEAERGFSIRFDANLDMRMNRQKGKTAAEVLNEYEEKELVAVFSEYGEVQNSKRLAAAIVHARKMKAIGTIGELKTAIARCIPRNKENQYLAQVFQALRIEVNNELEVLKELLMQSMHVLKKEGRLVVISYHSLEDRLVKNFMKTGKFMGELEKDFFGNSLGPFKLINKKPIVPGEEEVAVNSRARSAKLRIAEKL